MAKNYRKANRKSTRKANRKSCRTTRRNRSNRSNRRNTRRNMNVMLGGFQGEEQMMQSYKSPFVTNMVRY